MSRHDLRVLRYGLLLSIPTVGAVLAPLLVRLRYSGAVTGEPLRVLVAAIELSPIFFALTVALIDAFIVGRSAPVFAAAAAGNPMSLRQAWQMTRGQTLRLMLFWVVLFSLTYTLSLPVQAVANDLYVTLVILLYEPGQYVGSYYSPPFTQLVTLPSTAVQCAGMALGGCLFWRIYRGEAETRNELVERFE